MNTDDTTGRTTPEPHRPWRAWGAWTASFAAFPLAGLAGLAVTGGHVDSPGAALVGGAITGVVIGAGQALASRAAGGPLSGRRLPPLRWSLATAIGMGAGLLLGATVVDFRTGLADLMVQGALTGLVLGPIQAFALPAAARRWWWAVAAPALWALGWTVTTLAGVDVERQYTVFGALGALAYSALSGLLLTVVIPASRVDSPAASTLEDAS